MEAEVHGGHHPHGTGVRWLDVVLGASALLISLVSLWLGLHSARSTEKLVAASSYPYVSVWQSDSLRTEPVVRYRLENQGVGPARIEWLALTFKGAAIGNLTELLAACCQATPAMVPDIDQVGGVEGDMIPASRDVVLFTMFERGGRNPVLRQLRRQMQDIKISVCYCSVFDECYVRRADQARPDPVPSCPKVDKPFLPQV